MRSIRRRYAVLGVASALLLAACTGGGGASPSAAVTPTRVAASPSATATASSVPTSVPVTASASPAPSPAAVSPSASASDVPPSASPTAAPVAGRRLSAKGAYLEPADSELLTKPDPENGCQAHDPDLNNVACAVFTMPGGTLTWVAGHSSDPVPRGQAPRYVARIYQRLPIGSDALTFAAGAPGGEWIGSDAKFLSMVGRSRDTVLFAVTFQGSGLYSGYDLLTWPAGGVLRVVAHHGEDPRARRQFATGRIDTFAADYSDNSPTCCPRFLTHDVVRWSAASGSFRVQSLPKVPALRQE